MKTPIGLALALMISCTACLAAGPEAPQRPPGESPWAVPPDAFEQAHAQYEAGHWAAAYAAFAALADGGHREAARIALQMRQFGPLLYRQAFMAGPQQLRRWRAALGVGNQPAPGTGAPQSAPKASGAASVPTAVESEDVGREIWRHHGVG